MSASLASGDANWQWGGRDGRIFFWQQLSQSIELFYESEPVLDKDCQVPTLPKESQKEVSTKSARVEEESEHLLAPLKWG